MARVEIAVKGLFATPVAAVEVPGAAALNADLRRAILLRREQIHSVQASNSGGWHSDRDILAWGGAPVVTIITMAKEHRHTDDGGSSRPTGPSCPDHPGLGGPGDSNICHYHPDSFWSGTYYVADGGCASDPSLGGEFEMLDPRGPGPGMYAPNLKFAGDDGGSVGSAETIRPRPGLLFLFPSSLYHQVRPYRGMGLRISVAFNLGIATAPDA